jgi:hypothetical protein
MITQKFTAALTEMITETLLGTDLLRDDERCKSSPCRYFRAFALNW